MIDITMTIALGVFGAALGSFAAAQVWRLRAMQLAYDKAHGEKISARDKSEVQAVAGRTNTASDRSVCLHCKRQLAWYELVPVASWLALRGKCRTCKQPIGKMELLAELGLGAAFAVSFVAWPHGFDTQGIVFFVLWLIILTLLAVHWMYDAKWFLLLDRITIMIALVAVLYVAFEFAQLPQPLWGDKLIAIAITLVVLPGFYGALYAMSRGKWIGFGDVKLLVPFALMLPHWAYGVLLVFLANLIGCVVLLPAMLAKKVTRTTRVPFGPFLIAAFVITFLFGARLLNFYFSAILF